MSQNMCGIFRSYNLKEARETEYWIEIMIETEIVSKQKFSLLLKEIDEIIRTLVKIIKSLKADL